MGENARVAPALSKGLLPYIWVIIAASVVIFAILGIRSRWLRKRVLFKTTSSRAIIISQDRMSIVSLSNKGATTGMCFSGPDLRAAFLSLLFISSLAHSAIAAQPVLVSSATLSDGTSVAATPECSVGDLCATIHHPNGDVTEIYSEGAPMCQPYHLRAVRERNGTALFSYEIVTNHEPGTNASAILAAQCGKQTDTQFVLDQGRLRMGIYPVPDGSLSIKFEIVKSD